MQISYAISLWNYMHYAGMPGLERIFDEVRRAGFGIELWQSCWNETDLYDEIGCRRLKPALEGMPVSVHTVGLKSGNTFERHRKQIDAAAYLGAEVFVMHTSDLCPERDAAPDWELARRLVDHANARAVKLALENSNSFDFLVEAFRQAPGLYCCLDTGHVYLANGTMRQYLDAFKDRLIHLHLQNVRPPSLHHLPGDFHDHYIPSPEGIPAEDWQLLYATLEEIDFHGMAVVEIHPPSPVEMAFQTRAYLESVAMSTGDLC